MAALLVTTLWAGSALASGVAAPRLGAGWATPTFATPASMRFNPAAIARLSGVQLDTSLAVVWAEARYRRERRATYQRADGLDFKLPVPPAELDPTRSGWQPEVSGSALLPGLSAALSVPLGERLVFGLNLYPNVGAVMRFPDRGPHQWQLQEVALLATSISPGLAIRAAPWLDLGVAVDVVSATLGMRQVVDLASTPMLRDALGEPPISQANDFGPAAPPGVRELDVLGRDVTIHDAAALGWSFKLGALLHLGERAKLALAWQHKADLVYVGRAAIDMSHDLFTKDLASQGLQYPAMVRGEAFVPLPIPSALHVGLALALSERATLHLQASWVRYSVVRSLDVTLRSPDLVQPELGLGDTTAISLERDWNDTVELEALWSWQASERWRLGARGGYHSPMSPDATLDLVSIDGHRLVAGLMARRAFGGFALTLHLGGQRLLPRTVVGSRYDRGNGVYRLLILHGNVGLAWRF